MAVWLIDCGHDTENENPLYLLRLAQDFEAGGTEVRLDGVKWIVGKSLWDHIVDKVSELRIGGDFKPYDSCIFLISRQRLPPEAFAKQNAYALNRARELPRETLPLIGLMYV